MKYNPKKHHRRSIRLRGYDYSNPGSYYITICCHRRQHFFGRIEKGKMILNAFGKIAEEQWKKLPEHFTNIKLDAFQVMPNHIHFIIILTGKPERIVPPVGAPLAGAPDEPTDGESVKRAPARGAPTHAPTVGDITGAYKSLVANKCLELWKAKRHNKTMGKLWQRNIYEHIIRNERSLNNIRQYIINNPSNWKIDSQNTRS